MPLEKTNALWLRIADYDEFNYDGTENCTAPDCSNAAVYLTLIVLDEVEFELLACAEHAGLGD